MAKILGIDFGTKRVGVAVSDEAGQFAFPHGVFPNNEELVSAVTNLIGELGVATVVMGQSINFKGVENPVMEKARTFAEALKASAKIEVVYQPEGLTSAQARRQFENEEKTRSTKPDPKVDASAAALILEEYLLTHSR